MIHSLPVSLVEDVESLLLEKKDHLIKRLRNLTDEQKQEIIDFFKKKPNLENRIDWNRRDLTYDDFKEVMDPKGIKAWSQKRMVKSSGIRGLTEGEDYIALDAPEGIDAYIPLNHEASKLIACKDVGTGVGAWCTAWQKSSEYWNKYTNRNDVMIYILYPDTKEAIRYNRSSDSVKEIRDEKNKSIEETDIHRSILDQNMREIMRVDIERHDPAPEWLRNAETENASYYVNDEGKFTWLDGIWKNGTWVNGEWEDGRWENGVWEDGYWKDGYWKDGTWEDGTWKGGTWEDGTWWDGVWENGEWEDGRWRIGTWEDGTWKDGIWEDGTWKDGLWMKGTWENGNWRDGIWKDGKWEKGAWENGIWEDGKWENGVWEDGTWSGGIWKTGVWGDGTWENGTWEDGTWKDGLWKDGIWEDGLWEFGTWEDGKWESGIWEDGFWENGVIFSEKFDSLVNSRADPKVFYTIEAESDTLDELLETLQNY